MGYGFGTSARHMGARAPVKANVAKPKIASQPSAAAEEPRVFQAMRLVDTHAANLVKMGAIPEGERVPEALTAAIRISGRALQEFRATHNIAPDSPVVKVRDGVLITAVL